jgi:hypothetical protein
MTLARDRRSVAETARAVIGCSLRVLRHAPWGQVRQT